MRFESYIPFDEAKEDEYIHTMPSLMDILYDERVINVAWLDNVHPAGSERHAIADEIFNVLYTAEDGSEQDFNVIVPYDVFIEGQLRLWMRKNPSKVWKGNTKGEKIRGVDY